MSWPPTAWLSFSQFAAMGQAGSEGRTRRKATSSARAGLAEAAPRQGRRGIIATARNRFLLFIGRSPRRMRADILSPNLLIPGRIVMTGDDSGMTGDEDGTTGGRSLSETQRALAWESCPVVAGISVWPP